VERSEAEAIYDAGREACVAFLMGLVDQQSRAEERLRVLEQKAAASSRKQFSGTLGGCSQDASAASGGGARESEGVACQGREEAQGGRSAWSSGQWAGVAV
jgi:hypothetical protein